jgi:predicted DNA-binding transcriptional regulator AlpA
MATLPDDWWSTEDVATYLGVAASTVRAYLTRDQMPKADRRIGRTLLWRPETIQTWHAGRPSNTASKSE